MKAICVDDYVLPAMTQLEKLELLLYRPLNAAEYSDYCRIESSINAALKVAEAMSDAEIRAALAADGLLGAERTQEV